VSFSFESKTIEDNPKLAATIAIKDPFNPPPIIIISLSIAIV